MKILFIDKNQTLKSNNFIKIIIIYIIISLT